MLQSWEHQLNVNLRDIIQDSHIISKYRKTQHFNLLKKMIKEKSYEDVSTDSSAENKAIINLEVVEQGQENQHDKVKSI